MATFRSLTSVEVGENLKLNSYFMFGNFAVDKLSMCRIENNYCYLFTAIRFKRHQKPLAVLL